MNLDLDMGIEAGIPTIGSVVVSKTSTNKSATETITVIPTLNNALASDIFFNVYILGGHSNLENYGVGKHYTVTLNGGTGAGESIAFHSYNCTKVRCKIAAGSTTRQINLAIVNNPVWELNREITIFADRFTPKNFTIVDDSTGNIVLNGLTDFATWGGASGLIANDESAAAGNKTKLTAIVDYIKANIDPTLNQAIIYLPNSTYYFNHQNYMWPGITIVGESKEGVIVKRPSKDWYIANGINVANNGDYWYWMFSYYITTGTPWNSVSDSLSTGFRNCTCDGSYDTFWPFSPYTCFEKSHFMSYAAKDSATLQGNMKVLLENIHFKNNVTSNFSLMNNTDSILYHITNEEGVVGKGDYSFVGGNTKARIYDITNARHVDFEQNNANEGHFLDSRIDIAHFNCSLKDLQLGLHASATGAQAVAFTNCDLENFAPLGLKTDFTFTNCRGVLDTYGSAADTTIRSCKSFLWEGGTITINPPVSGVAALPLQLSGMTDINVVEFKDVEIIKGSGTFPEACHGFSRQFGNYTAEPGKGLLKLTNLTFTGAFDYCYQNYLGDNLIVTGLTVNGATAVFYLNGYAYDASHIRNLLVYIIGPVTTNAPRWIDFKADTSSTVTPSKIYHNNVTLDVANSLIKRIVSAGIYISQWDFDDEGSGRTITGGTGDPLTGLIGDHYGAKICTTTGYQNLDGTYQNAVWA